MSTPPPDANNQEIGRIVALSRDVFFGMRVRTVLRQTGYNFALVKTEAEARDAVGAGPTHLLLVDFNQPVAWDELADVLQGETPVLAFGSHTDVEGFRAAKDAGVRRVVSNGEFSRRLPDLIAQYRRP